MQRILTALSRICLILVVLLQGASFAASKPQAAKKAREGLMNKLLAPGQLIEGHKDLEQADCLSCHAAGKGVPDQKCLDCHKDIRQSMARPKSFHKLTDQPCFSCHSDHKGRDFDAIAFDITDFDHADTGFPLAPKHQDIKCLDCHTAKRSDRSIRRDDHSFFAKTATCVSCHGKDDPHAFTGKTAKKDCNSCHVETTWKQQITFNHKIDGHWELKGKHAEAACVACHKPDMARAALGKKVFQWEGLKQDCNSCHADYHGFDGLKTPKLGKLAQCQTCHKEESWETQLKFNHNTQTKYVLDGKHTAVRCNECHTPLDKALWPKTLAKGESTASSVGVTSKKSTLIGAGRSPPLRQYRWEHLQKESCAACHTSPHIGKFPPKLLAKPCVSCHVTANWLELSRMEKGKFDHTTSTKFPLTGKHAEITCKSCHDQNGKAVYKFANEGKQFCVSCHASVHKEQFSPKFVTASCADCHGTKTFSAKMLKPFTHDKTRFKLDGDHLKVKTCVACHTRDAGKFLATKPPQPAGRFVFSHEGSGFCVDCHKNVHIGQFHTEFAEKDCRLCHNTATFLQRKPFDYHTTHYDVIGKHTPLTCEKCHTKTREVFPGPPHRAKSKFVFPDLATRNCASCHVDPHKGKFGGRCVECHHEANKWSSIGSFHKNFTLSGTHSLLACEQCHVKDRRLTGLNDDCQFCHRKDDAHNGGLPECATCHTQQTWTASTFHHSMTDFPLLGAHRVAECNACHKSGIYQGSPTDCAGCHVREARAVSFPNHNQPGFEECGSCHNQFTFRGKK